MKLRRQRLAIGLIAAYALLLGAVLPAFAAVADPFQAYLGMHLCGPSGAEGDSAPATPVEHQQKCPLCGPGCTMGGHGPAAALADTAAPLPISAVTGAAPRRSGATDPAPLSLYPSDALSQGPPRAA